MKQSACCLSVDETQGRETIKTEQACSMSTLCHHRTGVQLPSAPPELSNCQGLTNKVPGNFLFIPLTVAVTYGFSAESKRLVSATLNHTSNGILHHFYGKSLWNARTQVLGALLLIINDLQKTPTQGLDVKKRRCKSCFFATPTPSFILPKRSPYLGISIKKPVCICKSPINMIYYSRVYVVYKLVYISNRQ